MTVQEAVNWCNGQVGQSLDFDGQFGAQCFDFFNFYYQTVTGRNPYSDGAGVPNAYQIYDIDFPGWTRVANDMNDPNQLPPQGSVIVYDGGLPGSEGAGHVAVIDYADSKNVTVWDQNWGGMYVHHQSHMWTGHERGWLIPNFDQPAPEPAPEPQPDPAPEPPAPEPTPPPEPTPIPEPEPAPDPTPVILPPAPQPQPKMSAVEKLIWAVLAAIILVLGLLFK